MTGWEIVSRSKDGFDITDIKTYTGTLMGAPHGVVFYSKYDVLINCIADTDTYSNDRESDWNVNYKGVATLVNFCNDFNVKLVHISSDYIYSNSISEAAEDDVPMHCGNWYGYTKLLADGHVQN